VEAAATTTTTIITMTSSSTTTITTIITTTTTTTRSGNKKPKQQNNKTTKHVEAALAASTRAEARSEERASRPAAAAEVDPWQMSGLTFEQRTQIALGQVPSDARPAPLPGPASADPWPFHCQICLEHFAVEADFQIHLQTSLEHKRRADALSQPEVAPAHSAGTGGRLV